MKAGDLVKRKVGSEQKIYDSHYGVYGIVINDDKDGFPLAVDYNDVKLEWVWVSWPNGVSIDNKASLQVINKSLKNRKCTHGDV